MEATSTPAGAAGGPLAGGLAPGSAATGPPSTGTGLPLPSVEQILAKRAAGAKLSRAEAGRLAWVNRPARTTTQPAGPAPATGGPALAGPVAQSASGGLPPPPVVDPDLCKRTAASLLETADAGTLAWLESFAVDAGADADTWKEFRDRACLKPGPKTVLVDTSPTWLPNLLGKFGFDVTSAPNFLAGVALLSWGFGVGSVAVILNKKAKERKAALKPQPEGQKAKGEEADKNL